jgi:predicted nuclease of predicted toxin-antitoxin system
MLYEQLEFWIDLNLPPILATWIKDEFNVPAKSFQELGFATTPDTEVFKLARAKSNIIVITTRDYDFVSLAEEIGSPPKILYLNTGNISNKELKKIILRSFKNVVRIFSKTNQSLVEITP